MGIVRMTLQIINVPILGHFLAFRKRMYLIRYTSVNVKNEILRRILQMVRFFYIPRKVNYIENQNNICQKYDILVSLNFILCIINTYNLQFT